MANSKLIVVEDSQEAGKTTITDFIRHSLAFYCGWPKAWSMFPLVEEVYKD